MNSVTHQNCTDNQGGNRSRPSLAQEARDLYELAAAYGDEVTMQIAMRDMEIAYDLERAQQIVEPLPDGQHGIPGCRYTSEERHQLAMSAVNSHFRISPPRYVGKQASLMEYPDTISTTEYAALHGVSGNTVRKWISAGLITAIRATEGRCWRIPKEEVA